MSLDDEWIARIKQTMAIDLSRGMTRGIPPAGLVEMLFAIPEVEQAFRLRADRRRRLPEDPSTAAEKREVEEALERVAEWLEGGFHERLVEELRTIRDELGLEA